MCFSVGYRAKRNCNFVFIVISGWRKRVSGGQRPPSGTWPAADPKDLNWSNPKDPSPTILRSPHYFEIHPLFWDPPTILRYPHYFEIFIFGLLNLKFLRRLIYIVFERGARRKKCNFLVIFFEKKPKNAFLACFFSSKLCLERIQFDHNRVFLLP